MCTRIDAVFSESEIQTLLSLPEVLAAKERLVTSGRGIEYFSVEVSSSIQSIVLEKLGLDLFSVSTVPMRWIRGDTPPHADTGVRDFEHTYLIYLTNSEGAFILDGCSYPITEGTGYVFSEGLRHETVGTGTEPRLLLGPMSEEGFSVGVGIDAPGGTTIYIRQVGSTIRYSPDPNTLDGTILNSWPVTVNNTNTSAGLLSIEFVTDITFQTDINQYFVCGSEYLQFGSQSLNVDGTRPIVTIDGITNYPGFIKNGDGSNTGLSYIYVFNLTIQAINGSSLASEGGWVGQAYFGKGVTYNYIVNCTSDGDISNDGGGIVGSYAGSEPGAILKVEGCSSSGIVGVGSGGIVGSYAATNEGTVICSSCFSTGAMTDNAGGILGAYAGSTAGSAAANDCYSTGLILNTGGGIGGLGCGDNGGSCAIEGCYSTGNILDAGGIVGGSTNSTSILNCYTTGDLVGSSGGLITADSTPTVTNCYTSGNTGISSGFILGGDNTVPVSCYAESFYSSSGWNSTNATTVLQGFPAPVVGDRWVETIPNTPFELVSMGYTPYTVQIIGISFGVANIIRTYDISVTAGSITASAIVSGKSYTLLQISDGDPGSYETITIDSTTGVITTTSATAPGSYILYLRNTGSYNITQYYLTVTEAGVVISGGAEEQTSCCEKELHLSNTIDYTIRNHFKEGNTLIGSTAIRRGPTFYGALYNKKMAYSAKW